MLVKLLVNRDHWETRLEAIHALRMVSNREASSSFVVAVPDYASAPSALPSGQSLDDAAASEIRERDDCARECAEYLTTRGAPVLLGNDSSWSEFAEDPAGLCEARAGLWAAVEGTFGGKGVQRLSLTVEAYVRGADRRAPFSDDVVAAMRTNEVSTVDAVIRLAETRGGPPIAVLHWLAGLQDIGWLAELDNSDAVPLCLDTAVRLSPEAIDRLARYPRTSRA